MRIKDLSPEVLSRIKATRYERFIEKHEGPFTYEYQLNRNDPKTLERIEMYRKNGIDYEPEADAEFMEVSGEDVLLPVSAGHHPNITMLHHFFSEDRHHLVMYIKDTTYSDDAWGAGFVAICEKFEDQDFYLATFYHEWYIIAYDPLADRYKKTDKTE